MTPPVDYASFRAALNARREQLPKRLRQCARYFEDHPDRVAFDTVAQVAGGAQVQPSAVVRFAKVMGFSGYSELQGLFRERYSERWPDRSNRVSRANTKTTEAVHERLREFAEAGHRSLSRMTDHMSANVVKEVTKALRDANLIQIAGFRRSFPVAAFLAYALEKQRQPCRLIDGTGLLGTESPFGEGHALIAVSFAPYTDQTIELVTQARAAGALVIAISDKTNSPIFADADHRLEVQEEEVEGFLTLSATFALAATLAAAVGTVR